MNHQSLSAFIWSVADLLRGDYKQSEYGRVTLPFTVLRLWRAVSKNDVTHEQKQDTNFGRKVDKSMPASVKKRLGEWDIEFSAAR